MRKGLAVPVTGASRAQIVDGEVAALRAKFPRWCIYARPHHPGYPHGEAHYDWEAHPAPHVSGHDRDERDEAIREVCAERGYRQWVTWSVPRYSECAHPLPRLYGSAAAEMEKQVLEWKPLFEHPLPGGMTPELVPFGDDGLGGTRCSARRQDDADLDGSLEPQDAASLLWAGARYEGTERAEAW